MQSYASLMVKVTTKTVKNMNRMAECEMEILIGEIGGYCLVALG